MIVRLTNTLSAFSVSRVSSLIRSTAVVFLSSYLIFSTIHLSFDLRYKYISYFMDFRSTISNFTIYLVIGACSCFNFIVQAVNMDGIRKMFNEGILITA